MDSENVIQTLQNMTSGEDSTIGRLIRVGDIDRATRMAYSILSMLEREENLNSDHRKLVSVPFRCFNMTLYFIKETFHLHLPIHRSADWKKLGKPYQNVRNPVTSWEINLNTNL